MWLNAACVGLAMGNHVVICELELHEEEEGRRMKDESACAVWCCVVLFSECYTDSFSSRLPPLEGEREEKKGRSRSALCVCSVVCALPALSVM